MQNSDYLWYPKIYLSGYDLTAIYKGKKKIWKLPYPSAHIRRPLMLFRQDARDFTKNGFAVLHPVSATHELEIGQAGDVTVVHPVDSSGIWREIVPNVIILAPCTRHGISKPQAFRIYRTVRQMDSSGRKTVTAYARHVFYDLNSSVIENVEGYMYPNVAVARCFQEQFGAVEKSSVEPRFYNLASDAWYSREDASVRNYYIEPLAWPRQLRFQSVSIASALIGGSGSIAGAFGLEFYADNFYFSLRSQMEGSRQNSFSIQYGRDMTGVSEDIDYTNAKTFLRSLATVSGYGHSIAISETGFGPFARPSIANFSFSEVLEPTQEDPDPEITRLTAASEQYWGANHDPAVSYSASYAPKQDKLTRQFLAEFDDRDVGDTGTVINSELGIETTQRIVYKKSDLLTGITLDVKLGNPPAYMTKPAAWDDTIRFGAPSAVEKQVEAMRNQ